MAALPWFAFDREAYISNTMHLTTEEHGAYLLLMLTYYGTGKPLPGYDRALASITKLPLERWHVIRVAMEPFFVIDGDVWRHERIEAELLEASSKHAAAVAKATAAALARHGNKSSKDAPSKPQADPKPATRKKSASSKPQASKEPAPSMPQAEHQPAHLHIHTTLSNERVVTRERENDDPTKTSDGFSKEAGQVDTAIAEFNPLGTTLPADWIPLEAEIATAKSYGMGEAEIEAELLTFHAYNAQHGTFSKNWSATWGMWCARWKEREAAKPKPAPPRVEVNTAPTDANWDWACRQWAKGASFWSHRTLGPAPDQRGCRCPREILEKYHIDPQTGLVAAPTETT